MQEVLITKLHTYLIRNNIDLLISLQQEGKLSSYLKNKVSSVAPLLEELLSKGTPEYIIEECCMQKLTSDLRPSKYNFLMSILEDEFETHYSSLKESGLLTYEINNLIEVCKPVFETVGFAEANENNNHLRYAIIGTVKKYLDK
jgi:hypothetical protein